MAKRSGPFKELFDLPIGGEMAIAPNSGETLEHTLKRLKQRASKWKPQDRAYRMKIDGEVIRAQRTQMGRNTVSSDWLLMKAGDRLLLKTKPTRADIKEAWDKAEHLNSPRHIKRVPGERRYGQWETGQDRQGRLIALCVEDRDGHMMPGYIELDGPSTVGWNGEWA